MPITPYSPVAFRCKSCGRLHTADDADEVRRPACCRVCGAGVTFDPKTGVKSYDEDNWEVLSEATPERLEELGLSADDVAAHEPRAAGTSQRAASHLAARAGDGPGTKDGA